MKNKVEIEGSGNVVIQDASDSEFTIHINNYEEITDENLRKLQSTLNKELAKYSTAHQKKLDAVQECYEKFQELQSFVNFIVKGERFTAQMLPKNEIEELTILRLQFKKNYSKNKISFPKALNSKIVSLFPVLDEFIDDYIDGIVPIKTCENIPEEVNQCQIAGIWVVGILDPTLEKMENIFAEIESGFREIYGTDDK